MKDIARKLYRALGYVLCFFGRISSFFSRVFNPIKEKSILFVTHPDDDALFFHTLIKKEKPYVVLLTTGFSIKRVREFRNMMNHYSVRYGIHSLGTRDERTVKLENIIKKELSYGNFENVFSHSETGEYGHVMHKRVGAAVKKVTGGKSRTTVPAEEIAAEENRIAQSEIDEKIKIFRTIYSSQDFVLEQYADWVYHEKITE